MINPYMTEAAAVELTKQIFADAMNRWTEYCKENFPELVAKTMLNDNVIIWKKIGYNTAGRTSYVTVQGKRIYEIVMNINYLYSKDVNKFIDSTVRHEIAHVIANLCDKRSWGHDKVWKTVARVMGDSGERCHNYAIPDNKPVATSAARRKTKFVCPNCGTEFELTPLMIKRCASGRYYCRKCKTNMSEFVSP